MFRLRDLPVGLIYIYQKAVSPFTLSSCRFYPSCSQYAKDAILRYGIIKGGTMSLIRIFKCHPLHPGGYDPVD